MKYWKHREGITVSGWWESDTTSWLQMWCGSLRGCLWHHLKHDSLKPAWTMFPFQGLVSFFLENNESNPLMQQSHPHSTVREVEPNRNNAMAKGWLTYMKLSIRNTKTRQCCPLQVCKTIWKRNNLEQKSIQTLLIAQSDSVLNLPLYKHKCVTKSFNI